MTMMCFENDLLFEEESQTYPTIGRWGLILLHMIKGAFVVYSGAHNIQASLLATGDNIFAVSCPDCRHPGPGSYHQCPLYGRNGWPDYRPSPVSNRSTFFWLIGIAMASAGIIADSRLHAGFELGELLSWYISTGLFLAPVVMVIGCCLGCLHRSCVGPEDSQ